MNYSSVCISNCLNQILETSWREAVQIVTLAVQTVLCVRYYSIRLPRPLIRFNGTRTSHHCVNKALHLSSTLTFKASVEVCSNSSVHNCWNNTLPVQSFIKEFAHYVLASFLAHNNALLHWPAYYSYLSPSNMENAYPGMINPRV